MFEATWEIGTDECGPGVGGRTSIPGDAEPGSRFTSTNATLIRVHNLHTTGAMPTTDAYDTDDTHAYECLTCGERTRATEKPGECPACGGDLRNTSMPRHE